MIQFLLPLIQAVASAAPAIAEAVAPAAAGAGATGALSPGLMGAMQNFGAASQGITSSLGGGGGLMSSFPQSASVLQGLSGAMPGGSDTEEIAKDNMGPFIQESMMHSQKGYEGSGGEAGQAEPGPSYTGLQGLMDMVGPAPQVRPKEKMPDFLTSLMGGMS